MLETFNPNPGHVYDRYFKGNHKHGDRAVFVRALVKDNPFIPEQYIRNLEDLSEGNKRRLLYGERKFDDNTRLLYRFDDIQELRNNQKR